MGNEGKKVENHCTRVSSLAHWGWDLWPTGVSLLANWVGSRQKPSAVFSFDSINCQLRMLCRKGREYEKTPLVPWQGKTAWFWSIDFDKTAWFWSIDLLPAEFQEVKKQAMQLMQELHQSAREKKRFETINGQLQQTWAHNNFVVLLRETRGAQSRALRSFCSGERREFERAV